MMKCLLSIICLIFFTGAVFAYEVEPAVLQNIKDLQIVDYNPATRIWSRNLGLNDIVFTRHITHGSGGYSEYKYNNNIYDVDSTYEFLYGGRLLGYNAHNLKFFELTFDGDKFDHRDLTKEEVQYLFPDVEILMLSEFKNNEISVELPIFRKRTFMLLNDTDVYFYKYQFEYFKRKRTAFNNIFEVTYPRVLIYSHYKSRDEMFPILKINVKPCLHDNRADEIEVEEELEETEETATPEEQESTELFDAEEAY